MAVPSSFCTICTRPCLPELKGFLRSLALAHPGAKVYIMSDTVLQETYGLQVTWRIELQRYSALDRAQMEAMGIWAEFQMAKSRIMDVALQHEADTMFLDCDIIVLDKLEAPPPGYALGLSPGFVRPDIVAKYGYYNGGMVWTNDKAMPSRWRVHTEKSRYYDQAALEDVAKDYSRVFEYGENYNVQTWRFVVGVVPELYAIPNKMMLHDKTVKFVHTHFNQPHFVSINNLFKKLFREAGMQEVIECVKIVETN
jgi:hypothetical protein